jgi:hypothetical protein
VLLDWWYEADHDYDRVRKFAEHGIRFWVCPGTSTRTACSMLETAPPTSRATQLPDGATAPRPARHRLGRLRALQPARQLVVRIRMGGATSLVGRHAGAALRPGPSRAASSATRRRDGTARALGGIHDGFAAFNGSRSSSCSTREAPSSSTAPGLRACGAPPRRASAPLARGARVSVAGAHLAGDASGAGRPRHAVRKRWPASATSRGVAAPRAWTRRPAAAWPPSCADSPSSRRRSDASCADSGCGAASRTASRSRSAVSRARSGACDGRRARSPGAARPRLRRPWRLHLRTFPCPHRMHIRRPHLRIFPRRRCRRPLRRTPRPSEIPRRRGQWTKKNRSARQ